MERVGAVKQYRPDSFRLVSETETPFPSKLTCILYEIPL